MRVQREFSVPQGVTRARVEIDRAGWVGDRRTDPALANAVHVECWYEFRGQTARAFFKADAGEHRDTRTSRVLPASSITIPIKGNPTLFSASAECPLDLEMRLNVTFE